MDFLREVRCDGFIVRSALPRQLTPINPAGGGRAIAGWPGHRANAVTIRIGLDDRELVGGEVHHFDAHLAVREAFSAMRRQLQAHVESRREAQ